MGAKEYEKAMIACKQAIRDEMIIPETSLLYKASNSDESVYKSQIQLQACIFGAKAALQLDDAKAAMEFGTAAVSLSTLLENTYTYCEYPPQFHVPSISTSFLVYGVACAKQAHKLNSSEHRLKLLQ